MPVIPVPGRWRQEDLKFEVTLGYTVRPCLKKNAEAEERISCWY
jgi:hypothetical protein